MAVLNNQILTVTNLATHNLVDDVQNVYTIQFGSSGAELEADVLDDLVAIFEALYTILAPIISVLTAFQGIRAVNRSGGTDIGSADFPTLTAGGASGQSSPNQVAYGVTFGTAALNRVGRKFIGVPSEGLVDGQGVIIGTALSALGNYAAEMLSLQEGGGDRTYLFGITDSEGANFRVFENATITPNVVTQRRRRAGVGS